MKKAGFTLCAIILLFVPVSSRASVQYSLGLKGAGFRLSFIVPQYYDVGFGCGVHADVGILKVLHFYPSFEYSHAGAGGYYDDWVNGVHYNVYQYLNEFALNSDLRFYPPFGNLVISPFFGGGIAFIVSNDYKSYVGVTDASNHWHVSTNNPGLGLDLLLGCDIPLGKVIGNVEMKIKLDPEIIFKMTAGLTFPLNVSFAKK